MKLLVLCAFAAGCSIDAAEYGAQLIKDPTVSSASSNRFACSTCHLLSGSEDVLPGYSLVNSVHREAFWGGASPTLLEAMNQCVVNFMRGTALDREDEKSRSLLAYLKTISPSPQAATLPFTVVRNIVNVPSGDAAKGEQLYATCAVCHGKPVSGEGRIAEDASIIPTDSVAQFPASQVRAIVIEKVRHGKFFGVGGTMPLYSIEVLSDAQLGHILAYLESFGLPAQ